MSVQLVLRVEWNETVRACRDPFDTKKFFEPQPRNFGWMDRALKLDFSKISIELSQRGLSEGVYYMYVSWSSTHNTVCQLSGNNSLKDSE